MASKDFIQKWLFLPWERHIMKLFARICVLHVTKHDQNLLEPFGMFIQHHVTIIIHFLVVFSFDPRVTR
jgi:hypothetical protein